MKLRSREADSPSEKASASPSKKARTSPSPPGSRSPEAEPINTSSPDEDKEARKKATGQDRPMPKSAKKARTSSESTNDSPENNNQKPSSTAEEGNTPPPDSESAAASHAAGPSKTASAADDQQQRRRPTGINRPMPKSAKKKLLEQARKEEEQASAKETDSSLATATSQPLKTLRVTLSRAAATALEAKLSRPSTSGMQAVGNHASQRRARAGGKKKSQAEEETQRKAKQDVENKGAKSRLVQETPANMRSVATLVVKCSDTSIAQTVQTGAQQEGRVKILENKVDTLTTMVKLATQRLTMDNAVQPTAEQLWARRLRLKIDNHADLKRIATNPDLLELFQTHIRAFVKEADKPSDFFQHVVYSVFQREFIARCFAPAKYNDRIVDSQRFEVNAGLEWKTIPANIWRIFEQECQRRPAIRAVAHETDKNFRGHLTNMKTQRVRDEVWYLADVYRYLNKKDPDHPHFKLAQLILIEQHLKMRAFNAAPKWDTEVAIEMFIDAYKPDIDAEWERQYPTAAERKRVFEEEILQPDQRERGSFYHRYEYRSIPSGLHD